MRGPLGDDQKSSPIHQCTQGAGGHARTAQRLAPGLVGYAELRGPTGKFAMGKIAKKPQPPAVPEEDEDPIWGNALADFFGVRALGSLSAAAPAVPEDKPAAVPKKPARKRAAPRGAATVGKGQPPAK